MMRISSLIFSSSSSIPSWSHSSRQERRIPFTMEVYSPDIALFWAQGRGAIESVGGHGVHQDFVHWQTRVSTRAVGTERALWTRRLVVKGWKALKIWREQVKCKYLLMVYRRNEILSITHLSRAAYPTFQTTTIFRAFTSPTLAQAMHLQVIPTWSESTWPPGDVRPCVFET